MISSSEILPSLRTLTVTDIDGTTGKPSVELQATDGQKTHDEGAESVLMTHGLADEHYEAVGDPYAAREFPGGLKVMFGLEGKGRVRKGSARKGRKGKERKGKERKGKRSGTNPSR